VTTLATHAELRDQLFANGLLFSTGVDGLYGRSGTYERIVGAVNALVYRWGAGLGADTIIHLPPVLPRTVFDASDYLRSFPDLMGSVHIFEGTDRDHAELIRRFEAGTDWPALLHPAEVVLTPAVCHPVYPMCAGRLPAEGRRLQASGYCFRHEPSIDPARQQCFRQHDIIYLGEPDDALANRDRWLAGGVELLRRLGLDVRSVPANDPFFGRLGAALAAGQREEALKFEGVAPIAGDAPTAIMSANYHRDHFGAPFGIETHLGAVAHTACVGFGEDRITLALLVRHGFDPAEWPADVQEALFG
jgi:seryl-tRNA synthetase